MRTENNDGLITLYLEGRIDTNNAPDIEKEILAALDGADQPPRFDASKLEYISSAGLRVLMRVRKMYPDPVDVTEVSPEVYDIFDTTGFVDLLNVKKRLREISVDGCEFIGAGAYGQVYRIDDETIAKLYNEGISRDFVEKERLMSREAFKMGVPTAIAFDAIKCGNKFGVVYELFNAKTVAQLICEDPSRIPELGAKAAITLKNLHKIEVPENIEIGDRKSSFLEWIDSIRNHINDDEYEKLCGFINSIPDRRSFLHGDYNSKNTMLQDEEILLIDIGDAAYGHPVFDIAMLMLAYVILPNDSHLDDETRRKFLGFDPALAKNMWGVMCGTYFGVTSPEEIEAITKQIMPLSFLFMACHAYSSGRTTVNNVVENMLRGLVLPQIEAGISLKLDFS